ncbi:MAG: M14 family zinc carboxypeptidase [Thermoguttaceae bacterium]
MRLACLRIVVVCVALAATVPCKAEDKPQEFKGWLSQPAQVEPKLLAWAAKYPDLVTLETEKTQGGHTAYAITVTNRKIDDAKKRKLLVGQPHAHEPASTAGMMDFLSELLDGTHADGRTTDLDRRPILDGYVLSFIPLGNPDGRARAPVACWDGTKYTNDEFLKFAFGRTPTGERCVRVGRWSIKDQQPAFIGIVYEQINDHEYVEPNRDTGSSFFKLVHKLLAQRKYDLFLDIHQTEFEKSQRNVMILLPFLQKQLPEPIRKANEEAGKAVIAAWQQIGANPIPEPQALSYGEDQIRYFRKCWGEYYQTMPYICVEIQNNNQRTPAEMQMRLAETSIRTSLGVIGQWSTRRE